MVSFLSSNSRVDSTLADKKRQIKQAAQPDTAHSGTGRLSVSGWCPDITIIGDAAVATCL